jgi:hypothetical protein
MSMHDLPSRSPFLMPQILRCGVRIIVDLPVIDVPKSYENNGSVESPVAGGSNTL